VTRTLRIDQRALIAVGCWVAATAVMFSTAAAAGYDPLAVGTWERWDSRLYLLLASDGYSLYPCPKAPELWCGTAGWFPAYPWLIGLLAAPGLPLAPTGLAVAWLFALATGLLLARTFLCDLPVAAATGGLAFAAFLPGAVYLHAVFPLSMFGFFALLGLWLVGRERWVAGGAAAAVAAATYHLGVLLIPVIALYALHRRPALRAAAVAALGPAVVVAAMWIQTGAADAFLRIQDRYQHDLRLPTEQASDSLRSVAVNGVQLHVVPDMQVLVVTALLVIVAVHLWRRRAGAEPVEWLLLGAAVALWVVPMGQENVGLYRTAATLVPLVPLVARLPAPLLALACASAVALAAPLTVMFLRASIV
jgi:hypothetical protein